MQRQSKKRQAILDYLHSTDSHPMAEEIYEHLKPEFPNLSFATVYRNLNQLKEAGFVRSMGTVMGQERFDGNVSSHSHVICTHCGKITDLMGMALPEEINQQVCREADYQQVESDMRLLGVCKACGAQL